MEPYRQRQGGAASSNPAAELEALLHAMRLGDPSSSHHHAAIPSLLLNHHQQQVLAPPPHMPQYLPQALLPAATPDMRLLPHPQARSYFGDGEGFFTGAENVSPVGAYFPFGRLLAAVSPRVRQRASQGARRGGARGGGHPGPGRGQVRLLRGGGVLPGDEVSRGAASRAQRAPGPGQQRAPGAGAPTTWSRSCS